MIQLQTARVYRLRLTEVLLPFLFFLSNYSLQQNLVSYIFRVECAFILPR